MKWRLFLIFIPANYDESFEKGLDEENYKPNIMPWKWFSFGKRKLELKFEN